MLTSRESTSRDASRAGPVHYHQDLTRVIIGSAMAVHTELGNGFLEKVYERALTIELASRDIPFQTQVPIPVMFRGQSVGTYFADVVADQSVLCELKALDCLNTAHESQLLHYLKATGLKVGLLLNFGAPSLQIKRMVY